MSDHGADAAVALPATEAARADAVPARKPGAFLHAGQIYASADPASVTTVLGSCVAVCLWDPMSRVGGMNHFLLPLWASGAEATVRFGNVATVRLVERVVALGARRSTLQAKVFGGACVLEAFRKRDAHLGQKNVEAALRVLAEERVPVVAQDVGGQRGRKLIFHTDDGSAWVKLL